METILVVDDEADVRELAREMLAAKGYVVLEAADGAEALTVARNHADRIDLLLTDVVMPNMSGPRLAAEFRRQRPDAIVLYMSGFALERGQQQPLGDDVALEPGSPILPKPFTTEGLTRKVAEVLRSERPSRSPFARKRPGPGAAQWWD